MSVYSIVRTAFEVLNWLIIIRVILSWIRHDPRNPLIRFIYEITEPILAPIRRLIPIRPGMPIDWSPFVAILLLMLVEQFVYRFLL
ncbi:YggT family protein [Dehalobacterium formicoaceticum]|uniref:YggT family protein n=1 Tax=Dehalobacterium formicoaceticum TaxID=51515 RepID=A0ABT1Y3P7_9FIRM|nr:YggT family protein [Dehalobacterium formicoaceticum]MCR6544539.1 YggT family protein [Dehalobacterium formicoaceticum]